MRHALPAGFGLALLLAATPAIAAPRIWTQEWSVTNKPIVHVRVDDGHVRVHRGPAGRVSTRVEYEVKRWGLLLGVSAPVVVFERKGNEVWINARDPKGIAVVGGYDEHFTVDVTVPNDITLNVRSTDGALDCEPLQGRFRFESTDGAVRAKGLKGEVDVTTGDGRMILAELDGTLRVHTGDGRLTAAGRFDVLEISSRDGRQDVTARPGSKVINAWSLESGDGTIELRIPFALATRLDARTRDGRLRVNLPIPVSHDSDRNTLIGDLNGGGPPLRIRTRDGSIVLGLSE